jgi:hypothetical protein
MACPNSRATELVRAIFTRFKVFKPIETGIEGQIIASSRYSESSGGVDYGIEIVVQI